jgi:Txe/YoeB family toxin of toxin-antitoxin system
MNYKLVFIKKALSDWDKLRRVPVLYKKAKNLLLLLEENPFITPPPYEKLSGDLAGAYSRRINKKHRLVYSIHAPEKTVKIIRMWTHYE